MHPADRKPGITGDNQALISELLDWFDSWPRDAGALGDDLRMTGALHPYDHLFSPICVNRLNLKNRLVMGKTAGWPLFVPTSGGLTGAYTGDLIAWVELV